PSDPARGRRRAAVPAHVDCRPGGTSGRQGCSMGMKRYLSLALVVAGGALATVATAAAPTTQLRSFVCQTARDPANRGISVTAVMRPVPHTLHMAIRFE